MAKPYDLSKPLVAFDHDSTLAVVLEMSGQCWLAAAIIPGVDRRPLQKLPVDEHRLLGLLERWQAKLDSTGKQSRGSCWPMRLVETASGWHAGSKCAGLRSVSYTRPASRSHGKRNGRKPTGSIPAC